MELLIWWYNWGLFLFVLLDLGAILWIFLDTTHRRANVLAWRIGSIFPTFLVIPSLLFRFSSEEARRSMENLIGPFFWLGLVGALIPLVLALVYTLVLPQAERYCYPSALHPSKPKISVYLIARAGPAAGRSFQLSVGETHIGRSTKNDIVLEDPEVSRQHALIREQGGYFTIQDLGSTNGTFVNDRRIFAPTPLWPGDRIRLGSTILVMDRVPEAPSRPETLEQAPRTWRTPEEKSRSPRGKTVHLVGQIAIYLGGIVLLIGFFLPWLSVSVLGLPKRSSGMEMLLSSIASIDGWYQQLAAFLHSVDPEYVLPPFGLPLQLLVAVPLGAVWLLLSLALGPLLNWQNRGWFFLSRLLTAVLLAVVILGFGISLAAFLSHPAVLEAFQDEKVNGSISLVYGYWGVFSGACLAFAGSLWECILMIVT